jgi:hypothetical protein
MSHQAPSSVSGPESGHKVPRPAASPFSVEAPTGKPLPAAMFVQAARVMLLNWTQNGSRPPASPSYLLQRAGGPYVRAQIGEVRKMRTTLAISCLGALFLGLVVVPVGATHTVLTPEAYKSPMGPTIGLVVKVHGFHQDCRPPAIAGGTGHFHPTSPQGGGTTFGIPVQPCKMPTSTLKCKDRPQCGSGKNAFCDSRPSATCCLVWTCRAAKKHPQPPAKKPQPQR